MKRSIGFTLVLLTSGMVIGSGGMYLIHLATSSNDTNENFQPDVVSDTNTVLRTYDSSFSDGADPREPEDNQRVASLEDSALHSNSFHRRFSIYSYVSSLSEQELTHKLQEQTQISKGLSYRVHEELQTALLERLALVNPESALKFAVAQDELATNLSDHRNAVQYSIRETEIVQMPAVQRVFSEWALSDLKSAINNAKRLDMTTKGNALIGILAAQVGEPLATYRNIAKELGDEKLGIDSYVMSFATSFFHNPRAAWDEVVALTKSEDNNHIRALVNIGRQWYEQDGTSVIDEISNSILDESIKFNTIRQIIWQKAVDHPEQAFQSAKRLPKTNRYSEILRGVVAKWSFSDPQTAYQAVSSLESSGLRQNLQTHVVITWAHAEPRYVLENLDTFPKVHHINAILNAISEILPQSPQEAAEIALQQTDQYMRRNLRSDIMRTWVKTDAEAAINWVYNGPVSDKQRHEWVRELTSNLVESAPRRAFNLALKQELQKDNSFMGTYHTGLEADIIGQLAYQNLELATELLSKVRQGKTRSSAFAFVGNRYIVQGNSNVALDLGLQLPKEEQIEYFQSIIAQWVSIDSEEVVASFKSILTEDLRSSVARSLLIQKRGYFTEAQREVLKQYISESDRQAVDNL